MYSPMGNKENSEIIFAFHSSIKRMNSPCGKIIIGETTWYRNVNTWQTIAMRSGTPFMEIPGYNFHGLMRYQVKKDHYLKIIPRR